jgi:eukaryotic-like serine/threonine-protein kinase
MKLPATVGKYCLEQFVGGAMGEVYLATETATRRKVTVQLLPDSSEEKQAFLDRARAASLLSHDNLIRTLDVGDDSGQLMWVREFIDGKTLTELIHKGAGPGPLESRTQIALELACGIAYLHANKTVHGAIDPDNIWIADSHLHVQLLDYRGPVDTKFITSAPYYLAPEQLRGAPPAASSDIYSFGLVLFEILTGKRARSGANSDAILRQAMTGTIDYGPLEGVPEWLAAIVRDSTAVKAANRPAAIGAIAERLAAGPEPAPVAEPTPAPLPVEEPTTPVMEALRPRRTRIPFLRAITVGIIACAIGGLIVGMLGVSVANAHWKPTASSVRRETRRYCPA